jgi:aminoglycoside phosphotransferase family enzyme/predicted kinase
MLTSQPTATGGFRIEELLAGAAYPHPVAHLKLLQTHISWVVLTGPYAYKIKKAVRYPFIDASTLERRRFLCEEELRLNRRFAPDLYVDVLPIIREGGRLMVGGNGEPVEFAVRMHEFDRSQELAALLGQNIVTTQDMSALAARIAESHGQAAVANPQDSFGSLQTVRAAMLANFALLRTHLGDALQLQLLERLASWTEDSLTRLRPLIESRRQSGMVRECHGDLHSRNIVRWRQRWLPFDCLEFDPDLRWVDVISDAAFLFMDLVSRRHEDLANAFLSRYLEDTGDYEGLRLLPLYAAYLALVRAKVDALGAETAGPEERRALEARLAERLATAVLFMDARPPALVIMHGVTASGKSWLSERLVSRIHAVRIRSDLERKRLLGVAPLARRVFAVGEGDYTAATMQRTYERLLECADSALEGSCSVIVDATFLNPAHRAMFRSLALRRRCRYLIVSCASDAATLKSRLEARARSGLDPSEATGAVLDQQLASLRPLTREEMLQAVQVDTSQPGSADAGLVQITARLSQEAA